MDPFIAEVTLFAGNFAPRNWAFCDGQLLSIASNSALFSLLGTTFGGDGIVTFALPDLRGRVAIHAGEGPGLTRRDLGSKGGAERVTLTASEIPSHGHSVELHQAGEGGGPPSLGSVLSNSGPVATADIGLTGGGQSHENMPPYLTMNYIIALYGTYPSRS